MDEQTQIEPVEDKLFSAFLWLLCGVSLYYLYESAPMLRQLRLLKGLAGLMMVTAEVMMVHMAVQTSRNNQYKIGKGIVVLLAITLIYNAIHIIYAVVWDSETVYLSLLGNPIYQPAFMLPVVTIIGLEEERLYLFFKCILYYTLLIIPIYILTRYMNSLVGMGLLFLIAFLRYIPRRWRLFLLVFAGLYMAFSYYDDARAPILRVLMGLAIMVFSLTPQYKSKLIKMVILISVILTPLYFLSLFVTTGYSVFEQSTATDRVSQMGVQSSGDTRTFLYEEIFDDLTENDAWLWGKGINGRYYSAYFDQSKKATESSERILSEVGFLDFLLKGGIVQTSLYLLLLMVAVFKCFFQSNSRAMVLIGLILLVHYVLLFVEDVPRFDLYNVSMWFCVGMAFSPAYLMKDDSFFEEHINLSFGR